jgi:hypothetical protein
MWILGQVSDDLALTVRERVVIGDFNHVRFAQVARREIGVAGKRHGQHLTEVVGVALTDHKSRAGCRIGA